MSGLRLVGPIGTPGHDKQTTPDFFAEFVKCSRERYCMLKVISQLAWRARQWKTAMKMVNLFVASPYVEITLGYITAKTSLQGPLWPSSKIFWLKCCLRCLKTIVCDCCLRWTCNITPAFSVTCIGDIFVHLSTCHLSTCFVTWPTSKW